METNRLKRFASEARNILMSGVKQRLSALGFQTDGSLSTKLPELMGGGSVFMGEVQSEDFYHKCLCTNVFNPTLIGRWQKKLLIHGSTD